MKTKFKSIKWDKVFIKNFISLAAVQGVNYLLPLMTLPYLVRVLGVDNFGIFSFATAIVAFFAVITDYGFNFSATREISVNKFNKTEITKIYSSVMTLKIILMLLSFLILCIMVFFIPKFNDNLLIYLLCYGVVLGQVLFPVWFFQGMEQMQFITVVNVFSKILSTVCIFIFINDPNDLYLVPVFMSLGAIIGGIYSLRLISKEFGISFKIQSRGELERHLKGGGNLFLTSFLSTLLTSSGILVLGFYASNTVVGIYSAIEKIFRAVVGLFAPITQALYPISCQKLNSGNIVDSRKYLKKIFYIIFLLTLITAVLICFLSNLIIDFFYGINMLQYVYILQLMMLWLIISVMNNIIGIQYLSAKRKDKFYLIAFVVGALSTTLLNFILIPKYLIDGIISAMIFGEIMLTLVMVILIKGKKL